MQVLQVLLLINAGCFILAGYQPIINSSRGTGNNDNKTDITDGSRYASEGLKGGNLYIFIFKVDRSYDTNLSTKSDNYGKYDFTKTRNINHLNGKSSSSSYKNSKDNTSNSKGKSIERSGHPFIHMWVKSSSAELKRGSPGSKDAFSNNSKRRYRRNSESSYYSSARPRCPCSSISRGGPSPQWNNRWQQRDEAVDYLALARTRSRRLFGSDSKGGYPFPHSLRKRRNTDIGRRAGGGPSPQQNSNWQPGGGGDDTAVFRTPPTWNQRAPGSDSRGGYPYPHSERRRRSCCSSFRSRTNINSDTTFRTGSLGTISFRTRDPEDSKGGYSFPHSCKKR